MLLMGCKFSLPFRKAAKPPPVVIAACDPTLSACPEILQPDENTIRPRYRPAPKDVANIEPAAGEGRGQTAESLDASTATERAAAADVTQTSSESELGKTVASLGAVAEQGFWLKTSLVVSRHEGRVVWASNGNSVKLTLIPKPGKPGSGSQISLAAMRALEIPLTALPELIVFGN